MTDETSSPIDYQLLDYLDGTLPSGERTALETLLRQDATLAARLEELRFMHSLMGTQKLATPSPHFTASVMQRLDERTAIARFSIRKGLLMVAGILVIVVIAAALVSAGVFDGVTTTVNLNEVTPSSRYFDNPYTLPSFSLNGRLIINGIIILNLTLAFIVLDKTVLRPLFRQRLNAH